MALTIAQRIRKAREFRLEVGGPVLIVRRPTDLELVQSRGHFTVDKVLEFVVGWEKMRAVDLYPGGGPEEVPFDAEACREWLHDQVDHAIALNVALQEKVAARISELEAAEKNSASGSTPAPSQASHLPSLPNASSSSEPGT